MPIGRSVLMGKPRNAAGQRDKYVLIEQKVEPTGGGFPSASWIPMRQAWMSKLDIHADEAFRADQLSAFSGTKFEAAYAPDIDPDVLDVPNSRRLVYLGKTYDVRAASMIGKQAVEFQTLVKAG